jgi:hypothetical protein
VSGFLGTQLTPNSGFLRTEPEPDSLELSVDSVPRNLEPGTYSALPQNERKNMSKHSIGLKSAQQRIIRWVPGFLGMQRFLHLSIHLFKGTFITNTKNTAIFGRIEKKGSEDSIRTQDKKI